MRNFVAEFLEHDAASRCSAARRRRGRSRRAQQPAMPVIGFLNSQSPDGYRDRLRAFLQGLKDAGYTEGENFTIEYRWAEGQLAWLPALAADLVRRRAAVIVALGSPDLVSVAKASTTTIPVVFLVGEDPVRPGLVASLARPGGNMTGVNLFNNEITAKRLALLRELLPSAVRVAALVNPTNAAIAETTAKDVDAIACAYKLRRVLINAQIAAPLRLSKNSSGSPKNSNCVFVN